MFWIGVAAFGFFFLGDLNDRFSLGKILKISFWAGCALLVLSLVFQCMKNPWGFSVPVRIAAAFPAALFLALMLIALFGSFSAEDGYLRPGDKRPVYTKKMYALCRHPGVVWFILLAVCLVFIGLPFQAALVYSLLNVLLALFEDLLIFPAVLSGYEEYRQNTRFLIPDIRGIRRCINEFRGRA